MTKLYTVKDLASMLDMHVRTVREYIKRGDIKAKKVGRKYMVTEEEYQAFIKA